MQRISEPDDPRLDDYRHLTDAAARRATSGDTDGRHGIFIVEGLLALEQLLASDHTVRSLLVTPNRVERLHERLDLSGLDVMVAERSTLELVTGFDVHRGVLAAAVRPRPSDLEQVVSGQSRVVLVEGVTDNENIGAIFRVVAALDMGVVVLDRRCADPLYRRSIRVSSGWSLRVPYTRVESTDAAIAALHAGGHRVVALTPSSEAMDVDEASRSGQLDGPVTIVVGAEGAGLARSTIASADLGVRIPMSAEVDSLNVATALAVVGAFSAAQRNWR